MVTSDYRREKRFGFMRVKRKKLPSKLGSAWLLRLSFVLWQICRSLTRSRHLVQGRELILIARRGCYLQLRNHLVMPQCYRRSGRCINKDKVKLHHRYWCQLSFENLSSMSMSQMLMSFPWKRKRKFLDWNHSFYHTYSVSSSKSA